jgi:hypothetical protein
MKCTASYKAMTPQVKPKQPGSSSWQLPALRPMLASGCRLLWPGDMHLTLTHCYDKMGERERVREM